MKRKVQAQNYFEKVGQVHLHLPEKNPLPSNIPLLTKGFVGRMEELNKLLRLKADGTTAFVLWGMGGVGKTQLAYKFIQEIKNEFDAHIKVDMNGLTQPITATQAMFEVIKSFSPEVSVNLNNAEIERQYSLFINKHKTLILLDNAKDGFQVSTLNVQNSLLVITSRENLVVDGGETIRVEQLSEEDAQGLLLSIVKERRLFGNRDQELAELVGRLPLALKPLAILLQRRLIDIDELIEAYKLEKKSLELQDPLREGLTIRAVFSLSERFLDEELKKFWLQVGVFPSDFEVEGAAFVSRTEPARSKKNLRILTSKSLTELIELNLLEPSHTLQRERYRLHDLIRDYVRDKIDPDEFRQLQHLHSTYYGEFVSRLNNPTLENLTRFDLERVNIENGFDWVRDKVKDDNALASLGINYTGYTVGILFLRLHFRECLKWLEAGLVAARQIGFRRGEGARLGNLASVFWSLGQYRKAIECNEQALAISIGINDLRSKSSILGNLGSAYTRMGEYREAVEYYEQALAIARELKNQKGEASNLGNLGNVYMNVGEYQKALEYTEQALAISVEIGDLQIKSNSIGNLGGVFWSLGDYQKAIGYYEQGLAMTREMKDLRGEANYLGNLGGAHKKLGNFQLAIGYYEQALTITRKTEDRQGEGMWLGSLGVAHKNLGNYQQAIKYYQQGLTISKEIGDRNNEGNCLGNLGNVYKILGEKEKAKALLQKAVVILESISSPNAKIFRGHLTDLENQ